MAEPGCNPHEIPQFGINMGTFTIHSEVVQITYESVTEVTEGVTCYSYKIEGRTDFDLAVVCVAPNAKTPIQQVVGGDRTLEGYISGAGRLVIMDQDRQVTVYDFVDQNPYPFEIEVKKGQIMQWQGDSETGIVFYEICYPPYAEDDVKNPRFIELAEWPS